MSEILKIELEGGQNDVGELDRFVREHNPELLARKGTLRSSGYLTEVVLALGTAGAFRTLFEILKAYFDREKAKKVVISSNRGSITIDAQDLEQLDEIVSEASKKLLTP